ncbi:hypothetical protein [Novibacillus thermophilus]|uniref:hypothetical protein n=1 Tax=Novibacillus thermophilus TaxID=1471761 RepID=UPI00147525C5|nr:hypothetical protein [Novibacillus thermophilus]
MQGTTEPDEEHVCPGADGLEFIGFRPDHWIAIDSLSWREDDVLDDIGKITMSC